MTVLTAYCKTNLKLLEAIQDIIQLPDNITDLTITMGVDKITTVTATFGATAKNEEGWGGC